MKTKLILMAALSMGAWVGAADWPQYRGPNADGIAPDTVLNTNWQASPPREMWRIAMSDDGYGGPAVANGNLYVVDHRGANDLVRCVSLADGKEVWTFTYADQDKPNYGITRGTPTIADGKVYTTSYLGKVHCLDAASGKVIWSLDMTKALKGERPGWGYAQSIVIDGEKAILCPGGKAGSVAAVDRNTGKVLWKSGTDEAGYSTPVIATLNGVKQYLVFSGTSLNSYAAQTGKLLWTFPWKTSYSVNASQPLVLGNSIFISSGYGTGCAMIKVDGNRPALLWKNKVIQEQFSSAIVHEGLIYGTTDPGDLVCLDPKTGADRWRQGGFEKGGIVAAGDVVLALNGKDGDLVMAALRPESYRELGRIKPLNGQSWTAPIIAEGKIIVRNKQALVCLDAGGK